MVVPILNDWGQVGACYNSCIVIRCFLEARLPCEEGSFISNHEYFMVIISIIVKPLQLKLPWERKTVQDNEEFVLVAQISQVREDHLVQIQRKFEWICEVHCVNGNR